MKLLQLNCSNCGRQFTRSDREHKQRIGRGAKNVFCSLRCNGIALTHPLTAKTVQLLCSRCSVEFAKPLKDYTRRIKAGATRFFCGSQCIGLAKNGNIPRISRYYAPEDRMFNQMIRRTTKRNFPNNLDIPYLKELWAEQNGRCALSNIPMQLGSNGNITTQASIDRIDSSIGYIKGNVQFVVCALNYAKSIGSNANALNLIDLICEHAPTYHNTHTPSTSNIPRMVKQELTITTRT